MKKFLFVAVIAVCGLAAKAQDGSPIKFSLGLEAALPLGSFGDSYSFGIGGSVQGDYSIAESLAITLNAGYINFSGKKVGSYTYDGLGYIPVLAGIKYNFSENVYGSAQLGATFASKGSGSVFTYAPGIGYKFSPNFDALLKYTGYSKSSTSWSTIGPVSYTHLDVYKRQPLYCNICEAVAAGAG